MIKDGTKRALGASGEGIVIKALLDDGYTLIGRNIVCRHGEIDIIAKKDGYIEFFEVKTRTDREHGAAASAVDKNKASAVLSSVKQYLYEHPTELQPRIHVAEVYIIPFKADGETWYLVDGVNIIKDCITPSAEQRHSRRDYR